ncbi:hypothetical protein STEG23_022441, partial [Scotinomys teguina]
MGNSSSLFELSSSRIYEHVGLEQMTLAENKENRICGDGTWASESFQMILSIGDQFNETFHVYLCKPTESSPEWISAELLFPLAYLYEILGLKRGHRVVACVRFSLQRLDSVAFCVRHLVLTPLFVGGPLHRTCFSATVNNTSKDGDNSTNPYEDSRYCLR